MLDRYVSRRGPLLANGLAYGLLFAFFAGIWIAVSVFGLIMVGNIDWQQMLIDAVREVIPGVADSFLTSSALG
ncbi:YhjD/YihY/BrkB family envelope integrity protein, partial [Bifidobacterium longum]|uniref:YhjD/YihY/BrkB family envelope integrity protein n=1 Tax=Bifidobacterium longum TaxID=216816 RepID=UPI0018D1475D